MNILTEKQRKKALSLLIRAPDEILVSAVVDLRKHWAVEQGIHNQLHEVASLLEVAAVTHTKSDGDLI